MLTIADLSVKSRDGKQLLSNVSLRLDKGECVGLTGASGAGKTTLIRTIMGTSGKQLLISGGDIQADGKSILEASYKERRAMCGRYFGFIPQNSMTSFFSNVKIGKQIIETYRLNLSMTAAEAHELAAEMLRLVNLSDADRVMSSYPGQLSGGMLQRVAMSIVLGIKPTYLLADEPTSALDRDNRALLTELLSGYKDGGILFISHDAEAIVSLCSSVCVMEHGRIVESKETGLLFRAPQHPWTKAFVNAAERSRRENAEWKQLR